MQETIIHTDHIYDGRVVKLDLHEVRLPNGETSKREIVNHPGAVAIIALDSNNRVLLVRQYRMAAGKIMLEIPAGTLEPNELPNTCAERELQEETGFKPGKLEALGGIYAAPGYTTEYIHLFLAMDLVKSSLDMDSDEFIELETLTLAESLALIDSGEINDSKTVAGLLRVARHMRI